ncbi:MAG: hypothetical protein JOY92_17055 [Verrucomicrobia bacterium]|nr:hypothetical protein [Verrucomicrobiota bacterium]
MPFTDGDLIYTLLFRDKSRLIREDISEAAWRQLEPATEPFSFWKSRYQAPSAKPPETVPRESAESLLRRLLDEDSSGSANARYVLAIMLERKRILRQVDVRESGDERILVYEHAKTGDVFLILDPRLNLADIEPVQQEVSRLLNAAAGNATSGKMPQMAETEERHGSGDA